MTCFGDDYAQLYDALYRDKPYRAESEWISSLLSTNPSDKRLLDFGCGTGRHAIEWARQGWKVTGVDLSASMRARAESRAQESGVAFHCTKALPATGGYDAVVSLFAVMNYLKGRDALASHLMKFGELMKPDAFGVLEIWNGAAVPFFAEAARVKEVSVGAETWYRVSQSKVDWLNQRVEIAFQVFDSKMSLESAKPLFSETHTMWYYTPSEVAWLLDRAGLDLVSVLPAYEDRAVQKEDFNLAFVFRRKNG